MGGTPSRCIGSLQFPYSSVNFWQGDQLSFYYPAQANSADSGDSTTGNSCYGTVVNADASQTVTVFNFQVSLNGPNGATYACDDFQPNQAPPNQVLNVNCPGVTRDSLAAGSYYFTFTTQNYNSYGSTTSVDSPSFTVTRKNIFQSCADSTYFPDRQDSFNFASDDPNLLYATYAYSAYQCAGVAQYLRGQNGFWQPSLIAPSGTSYYDNAAAPPNTSPDASPYNSPTSYRAYYYNQIRRGSAAAGRWRVQLDVANSDVSVSSQAYYYFTISHNDNDPPVPSTRGVRRRQEKEVCPLGYQMCPIPGTTSTECLDTMTNLEACGGCPGTEESVDCTMLSDVNTMSCVAGVCQEVTSTEDWGLVLQ